MKFSKILLTSAFALSTLFVSAQTKTQEVTETAFNPHWYFQAQVGVQETLGETAFGKLLSPNAQVALGYQFNPYIGTRLAINGWQSKGAFEYKGDRNVYSWNFVAPTINVTADLTNIFGGYKPCRVVSVGVFAGIGANLGFGNDEAKDVQTKLATQGLATALPLYWDGSKARFLGTFGANVDFKVSKRVSLGIELQANTLADGYNSKKAANADWYFNALAGVKIALGATSKKVTKTVEIPVVYEKEIVHDTVVIERVVEKPVEVVVPKREPLRRDIFFTISNTKVSNPEMKKVEEVANYLKANPDAKVVVTGYADKGTGSVAINMRLSKQRAEAVAKALTSIYGIDASRITVKSMDESFEQPYNDPIQNRVAICIAQ